MTKFVAMRIPESEEFTTVNVIGMAYNVVYFV